MPDRPETWTDWPLAPRDVILSRDALDAILEYRAFIADNAEYLNILTQKQVGRNSVQMALAP